ncbi:hypothetical protein BDY21DRAFT_200090 [Lineolata rhizophorae]|uniref:Phosphotransferase n=1 Tax=Lineolata rhizophorae TaxID=578093 RepID=A0A6A6P5K3_9PEZI|nr:hypothetical protein BDY21DRAFT_200090 [Lineolata rhizophorae]
MEGRTSGLNHLEQFLSPFSSCVHEDTLLALSLKFSECYKTLARQSTEHFLPTPVTNLPNGSEKGRFLAIDVGGTNLRVGFIDLLGEDGAAPSGLAPLLDTAALPHTRRSHEKAWPIEEHLKMDKAEDLFRWIGDCIAEVVQEAIGGASGTKRDEHALGDEIPLGITFSFPMTQESMSEATLMPMGKGFAITSDLNLGKMLLAGYARHCEEETSNDLEGNAADQQSAPSAKRRRISRLPTLKIAAITNDTIATFASLAYKTKSEPYSKVAMGLIMGTGTNATIPLKLGHLHESKRAYLRSSAGNIVSNATTVVNTEWSIRGTDAPMRELNIPTKWDKILDRNSETPGFQPFEYMTAGRYLGELVRLAFLDLLTEGWAHLNANQIPPSLLKKNAISTQCVATVIATGNETVLKQKLAEIFPGPSGDFWTPELAWAVRRIAEVIQIRSCGLIAAAIIGLLACAGEITLEPRGSEPTKSDGNGRTREQGVEELVVAYTGSVMSQYPGYRETCQGWIDTLIRKGTASGSAKTVVLKEAKDGGIIGAAVLAGMVESRAK